MTARGGLLERDGVTEAVAGLVDAVNAGRPGALFVVGEAGLGKTALLEGGRSLAAAAGLSTGVGRGHPMEGALPFGVLVQVLDDVGGHGLLREDLPGAASGDDRASRFFSVLRWLERRDEGPRCCWSSTTFTGRMLTRWLWLCSYAAGYHPCGPGCWRVSGRGPRRPWSRRWAWRTRAARVWSGRPADLCGGRGAAGDPGRRRFRRRSPGGRGSCAREPAAAGTGGDGHPAG